MLRHTILGLTLACGFAMVPQAHAATSLPAPTVQTANGPVTGTVTDTISTFLGIPYAAPPVGELRWKPPQPRAPWTGALDATTFGANCPEQQHRRGLPVPEHLCSDQGSQACACS